MMWFDLIYLRFDAIDTAPIMLNCDKLFFLLRVWMSQKLMFLLLEAIQASLFYHYCRRFHFALY